jgi:O-antigen/teichoic acid export membrane protein
MDLAKKITKLGTGTLVANIITLLALPFIAKIYSPYEYGKFTLIFSVVSIILPFATLRLENLIVAENSNEETHKIIYTAVVFSFAISILTLTILFTEVILLDNIYFDISILNSILLSTMIFFQAIVSLIGQYTLRNREYTRVAVSSVFQNFLAAALQIITGLMRPFLSSLLVSFISGRFLGILILIKPHVRHIFETKMSLRDIFVTLKKYLPSSKLLIFGGIFESFSIALPSVALSFYFGFEFAGYAGMVNTIMMTPVLLVGGAFGSVLLSELSYNGHTRKIKKDILKYTTFRISLLSTLYGLFTLFFGSKVLIWALGSDWNVIKQVLPWLAFSYSVHMVWYTYMNLIYYEKKWQLYFKITFLRFFLSVIFGGFSLVLGANWVLVLFSFYIGQSVAQIIGLSKLYKIGIS